MHTVHHLDREVIDTLKDVMGNDFPVLIETFLKDSSERIASLQKALAANDAQALRRAAHSLKGSCSNLGAQPLADMCQQLEHRAHQGELDGLEHLLGNIQQEFAQVRLMLKAI